MSGTEIPETRLGPVVRPKDPVEVAPSKKGKRDGYVGVVKRITALDDGRVEIDVYGAPAKRVPAVHTYEPERLSPTTAAPTHKTAAPKEKA